MSQTDLVDELERLAKLRSDGVLSEEEFARLKSDVLNKEGRDDPRVAAGQNNVQTAQLSEPSSHGVESSNHPANMAPPPRYITAGYLIGWGWAVFAGISGVGLFIQGDVILAVCVLVSAIVALPPAAKLWQRETNSALSGWVRALIVCGLLLAAGAASRIGLNGAARPAQTADTSSPATTTPSVPATEERFISAVSSAMANYNAAQNDMAKGGTRAARRNAICEALQNSSAVDGWVGTIESLSSNSDGKGVLVIKIAPDVTVGTWNNAFSDIGDNTLLEADSDVFKTASTMSEGDTVVFSGSFVPSDVDCVKERSITLEGSMEEPAFLIRFASVSAPGSPPVGNRVGRNSAATGTSTNEANTSAINPVDQGNPSDGDETANNGASSGEATSLDSKSMSDASDAPPPQRVPDQQPDNKPPAEPPNSGGASRNSSVPADQPPESSDSSALGGASSASSSVAGQGQGGTQVPSSAALSEPPLSADQQSAIPTASQRGALWYYCSSSHRFYPYVHQCAVPWRAVKPYKAVPLQEGPKNIVPSEQGPQPH